VQAGGGRVLRVHATRPVDAPPLAAMAGGHGPTATIATATGRGEPGTDRAEPGMVRIGTDRHPYVATGSGWLMLREVQWEGKPKVSGPDFVNGLQPSEREALRLA